VEGINRLFTGQRGLPGQVSFAVSEEATKKSKNTSMGQVKPINWAGTVANGENLWVCMQAFQNQLKWALCSVPSFYNSCPNLSRCCEERPSPGHHQAPSKKGRNNKTVKMKTNLLTCPAPSCKAIRKCHLTISRMSECC
jgi:hypothetical protein